MENHPRTTPKDFFLYLFAAGTLYASATTLITLLWQLINYWLPDGDISLQGTGETLRWAVTVLVVVFPAYVAAMWHVGREVDRVPGKREIWVRRWFVWATLFIAAVVLLCDTATLLYAYLGGDLALRFLMKAVAVGLVAKGVFWYHWYLLRRQPGTGMALRRGIAVVASLSVAAAIAGAVFLAGSPAKARAVRDDATRVRDLQDIQYQVTNFWQQKDRLPAKPSELVDPANPTPLPTDPRTGAAYRYEAKGKRDFTLCAVFESELNVRQGTGVADASRFSEADQLAAWQHGAGEKCFTRTIDPDRYPRIGS